MVPIHAMLLSHGCHINNVFVAFLELQVFLRRLERNTASTSPRTASITSFGDPAWAPGSGRRARRGGDRFDSLGFTADRPRRRHPLRSLDRASVCPLEPQGHQVASSDLRGPARLWHEPSGGASSRIRRLVVRRHDHRRHSAARPLARSAVGAGFQNEPSGFGRNGHLRRLGHCRRQFRNWCFGGSK